ncbi:non-ribosomal peptide synthetase [Xanthomonas graminis]|uniref:Non-ribosomal peptide synthetase n=5 Tax=Xanthomonas translucens group TaxID=3390202 RepID=A0A0K2ZD25_9XANT|nr:non-ribosomal peptide synthetase [Xanthomonas translucens]UKE79443.1 non-ribosomal peptide synthetase [Xanthomonas translucens pv. arrhenatheri]CTP83376.1 non-ribosomal peptide synthetase [Xanthomonas translucens pv. arrhenatheri LMG 727]
MDRPLKTLPASFAQQRLWFLARLDPRGSTAYHLAGGLRLHGSLDEDALRAALDRIVERHEVLRTCLVEVHGQVRQRILEVAGFTLQRTDLGGHAQPAACVDAYARDEAGRPFDLAHGPLIRGHLLRLDDQQHALLVTMHHLVSDAWSMGVLLKELGTLYAAFLSGHPDPLPPLPVQYADYAIWQHKRLGSDAVQRHLSYWKTQLGGAPTLLPLPLDHPRPALQDYAGASVEFVLPESVTQGLLALARSHRCSLFSVLLAAWALLLSRLSGEADLVIGTAVAGRTRSEVEPLIGLFVNTVALRLQVPVQGTLSDWLQQVRDVVLSAQDHQDLPFERVVEVLQPPRALGHTPIYQVMFALDAMQQGQSLSLPGLEVAPLRSGQDSAEFDLALSMQHHGDTLGGRLGYATALFDGDSMQRHVAQFLQLLQAIGTDANPRLAQLPWLPQQQRDPLLYGFNATEASLPPVATLTQALLAQVQRAPQATALIDGDLSLSYAQVWNRAACLAEHLQQQGLQPGQPVALLLPRSASLVIAQLAVLRCGACYVPMDPDQPAERLGQLLRDCRARLALVQAQMPPLDVPQLRCLDPERLVLDAPAPMRQVVTHLLAPAYVMYTSGSTGQPKGVAVSHGAVLNLVLQDGPARLHASDRVAFASNPAFDSATLEVWGSLLNGATVVVVPSPVMRDPQALGALLERERLSVLILVAGVLRAYAPLLATQLGALRLLLTGGDVADPHALARVFDAGGQATVLQTYGPTESTQFVTALALQDGPDPSQRVPIGRPLANTRLYVLDRQDQPVPIGVAGELHIAGAQLAQGYLHRPALSAERFVPDPFAQQPGERMFRTGDLARWLADGRLDFLGRNDAQVKIRGFRIEPGEIEAALHSCAGVREALVVARDDTGDKRLVAYLVGDTSSVAPATLRAQLAARLPEHMLPAAYVQLEALPLTPNGKLDRAALPAPAGHALDLQAYAAPLGDLEQVLAALWSELLGVEQVGRNDDFFALGGHSLLAVQLISRLRERLGVELPLADIFAHPRVAALATVLANATPQALPPIVPVPRTAPLPLSFAQQRLWFLVQRDAQADLAYLMPNGLRLRGTLDRHALRQALDRIVARHESLRTRIALHQGEPVQIIDAADVGFRLCEHDLSACPDPERQAQRHTEQETQTPFDLAHDTLARGQLLRLGDDDHVLLVTLHHLVSDGWSMGLLVRELSTLYTAFAQGQPDPLPPLSLQYADIAVWQRRWISGEVLQRQRDFWVDYLHDTPPLLELPTDRPRPPLQDYSGDTLDITVDADLTAALRGLSQRHGTTLFMTLLAGWAVLLSRLSGQDQVVIGTPIAGRDRTELEPVIGLFVNSLALQIDLRQAPDTARLLSQVRATTLAAQAHQHLPFEQIVEALKPVRSTAHSPLFQVMFAWQNAPEGRLELPGLTLRPVALPVQTVQFDLEIAMSERDDMLVGSMAYATALFERGSIERHVALFIATLRAMAADAHTPVARLPALSAAGHAQLRQCNDTPGVAVDAMPVHRLLERQVVQRPDAIAVQDAPGSLDYAGLNRRANRLAHHLIARGVAPDVRVALCMERGVDAIVAILAVLKAGGAYVPLDPAYPSERLTFMLADSCPHLLIADAVGWGRLPSPLTTPLLRIDADAVAWSDTPSSNPSIEALQPGHLAYLMYTSGSSGQPKGVAVTHAGLHRYVLEAARIYGLTAEDRVLQCNSLSFDIAVDEIFVTLAHGATLVQAPFPRLPAAAEFSQTLDALRISVLNLPTAYWHTWVAEMATGNAAFPQALRLVVSGGEAVSADAVGQWHAIVQGPVRWLNAYGPTETVCGVSFGEIAPNACAHIGAPIAGTRFHLLNDALQRIPTDTVGQLWIAGAQLARGYHDRPALTAERFVPDPFAPLPGQRMYRSGDLARQRADGVLEFLGRNDTQVKIRGFRIELGEIEAALRACEGIREAVVVARDDTGQKRLVAYLIGNEGPLSAETLRAQLAARLPEYMLPAAYVALDALPLTVNGKLDRRALPIPPLSTAAAIDEVQQPQGAVEQALAALWRELLGLPQLRRDDDFFALGGHSLLAVQLISRVRTALGVELQIGDVFNHPQLHALARCVVSAAASTLPAIVPADRSAPLPLSFAQQRLWFLAQLDGQAGLAYLMPNGLRLRGRLDRDALRQALNRLVARHATLRTRIGLHHDEPVQRIAADSVGFPLSEHDLSACTDPEAQARSRADQEADTPFDLAHDTLARGQLLRLADDDHVLLITLHHLICDGWSMGLLVRELSTLYAAFVQGLPDPLPPLQLQYTDVAVWQHRWLEGDVLQRQREVWIEHLHDAPALLELPTDRPRPPRQDHRGDAVGFAFDAELTAALKSLSQRHGTTVFMTLLAAWGVLLARLAGQEQVVIGTPVANRTRSELEPLIGLFVNTQALCIDLRADPSVAGLLAQVRATALAAQQHQDLPFEQLIAALNPARNLAHHPVFQAMFTWQSAAASENDLELPGLQLQSVPQSLAVLKFDLDLTLEERDACIVGTLGYATALFDATTIQRWWRCFEQLLHALTRDDAIRVSQLPWLDAPQRQHLLADFGTGAIATVPEQALHQLFETQARCTPDAIAVVSEQRCVSYAALDAQANRLAQRLLGVGMRAGARVAIALPRSIDLIVAQLAVLKCGAAYVPLDEAHPSERLLALIADAQASVLIHAADSALAPAQVPCLTIDDLDGDEVTTPPAISAPAAAAAYVMYTSGSTGTPKGVTVSHGAVLNLVLQDGPARLQPDDRVAFASNPAFDSATLEVWGSLLNGATVVVVPAPVMRDPQALGALLVRERLSVLILVAGVLRAYAPVIAAQLGTLRLLLTGGDVADPHALAQVFDAGGPATVLQTYGPTESTQFVTALALQQAPDPTRRVPIGRPLANTRLYVLDRHGQPTPIGVAGELHIAGAQLAQGYLHRPALTAERFVPDPFAQQPGERMYKTGDLARWRTDGLLEFLGRNDDQVKIRGFRIEPGEIEAALRACAGVQEAVVVARNDTGDKRLVAYVVADQATTPADPATLRLQLAKHLPEHMLPAAYVPLDALPLTPNGKLDRVALPSPDDQALDLQAYVAPQGDLEHVLATLWSELLGVEQVGRHDDFFALGGHSLLAVKLIERLRRLGWQIDVRALFAQPTLAGLAGNLQTASTLVVPPNRIGPDCTRITPDLLPLVALTQPEIGAVVASVDGGAANVQDIYPLAPLQEGLLFHHLADPLADPYLHSSMLGFPSKEQLDAFLDALDQVIARHDILRTGVVWQGLNAPLQVVWRQATLSRRLHVIDGPEVCAQLQTWMHAPAATVSLQQVPLIHAHLARDLDAGRWLLGLQHHHLVMDHTTLELLIEEVHAHLAGRQQQLPPPLPFRDFVAHTQAGVSAQEQQAFFTAMLADIDAPTAPFGVLAPVEDPASLQQLHRPLPSALAQAVRAQARRYGVSAASLFHLAYALVLARSSGRNEAVFATLLFGRMHASAGVDRVLGMFLNTLPIRLGGRGHSVLQALRHTQLCLAQLLHHEHAPLALAQRCSPLDTSTPLLNALLNYRYAGGSAVLDDDLPQHDLLQAVQQLGGQERTHYPLVVSVNDEQASGGFSLDLQCVQQIGTERIAAMLLQTLHVLVQALKHAPQTALHALDLLSENERAELQHFNATTVNLAASGYLHRQIEAQAQRTPQAIALVDDALALSYADLDTRANQLAHHLIALGVGPDVRVAVCLPRGVDLVVALLAVLKAGGAYVPLDPVYPRARLDFMLQDSAARCLLTHTALADLLPGNQFARVCMDDTASWAMHPAHTPATQDVGPHHLAYVIYTSGSSGHPKGVMISHHALTQFLAALHTQVPLSPEDRLLAVTTVCFDIAGLELFAPLVHGARVVIAGDQAIQDPAYWSQLLDRHAISVLQATPAFWQMLLDAGWQSRPGLRLLCGGEALRQDLAQGLRAGGGQLCNLYGPTEATIWASLHPVPGDDTGNVVPLGRPLANTQLWVLDASHQLVPLGVAGELYIAGPQLARGYLGRPDLTAERFVPDPFAKHPGERMYKTGDLARWRADGVLESLGRNDAQVKIRGVRIELGEIETALRGCAGVREATVLLRQDIPGEPRLVAYLVTEQPEHADPLALRDALAAGLSEVMLPTAYVRLDALPLSANGKLDRRALPAPDATAIVRGDCLPPANAIERSLAKLWASVLGLQRIGRDDHFFELGGHSLSAMRLMTAANRLGLPLTLNLVYAHPTLRMQADSLLGGAHRWGTRALAARRQGTRPPLFVVPTGIGDIAYAFELAAHLDADIPVYALPWPDPLPATLEALAAQMVELIQAVQPQGPYHLLGYSSGGLLAYAIAQHFGLHDQPIAFLGLLDCDCPDRAPDPVPLQEATKRRLLERVETMLEHGAYRDDAIHAACRDLLAKAEQASLQELAEHAAEDTVLNALAAQEQTSLAEVIATARMTATFERMWPTYWVQALAPQCPLTVLHASEPLPAEVTLGWTRVLPAGQVRTIAVPGNHVSLIEAEHLPRLGQIVSTAMAWRGPEVSRHRDEPAFALQSAHSHAPFVVCVPGAGDSVTSFVDLSSALGEACNVIGMQPRGTDGCQLPFGSVELAAQRYLDALPAITAGASPLHLIGHSFGGWVVYEMALRLHALGRPAASLTLIDTRPPNQARVPHDASRDTIVDYFLDALQLRLHAPLGIDRQTLHRLGQDALLQALHRLMVEHRLMPARSRPDSLRGSLATFAHCCRTAYIPARPYPGTLHLVLVADTRLDPEQQAAERLRLRQAWAAHAADLQPWHGPGNHMTVLAKPHSQLLAQWWTSSVRDNARPSTPHAPLPPGTTVIA